MLPILLGVTRTACKIGAERPLGIAKSLQTGRCGAEKSLLTVFPGALKTASNIACDMTSTARSIDWKIGAEGAGPVAKSLLIGLAVPWISSYEISRNTSNLP